MVRLPHNRSQICPAMEGLGSCLWGASSHLPAGEGGAGIPRRKPGRCLPFCLSAYRLCEIKQRPEGIWVDTQSMRSRPGAKIKVATLILIHTGASDHFCRKNPWTRHASNLPQGLVLAYSCLGAGFCPSLSSIPSGQRGWRAILGPG